MPSTEGKLQRLPIVLILHDAGQDGGVIMENKAVVNSFLDRGYAVIAPNATKRKYVRVTTIRRFDPTLTLVGGTSSKSEKKYPIKGKDGRMRLLRQSKDRGWYFYTTDTLTRQDVDFVDDRRDVERRGRDEHAFLREVLFDAAQQFWVDPGKVVVVGIGHGAALAWQIACLAPEMALSIAPINGGHWGVPPRSCRPGGRVVHTHHAASDFWPIDGREGTRKRFGQTSLGETLDLFARSGGCEPVPQDRDLQREAYSFETWRGCDQGSSLGLILSEREFDFPGWWFDRILRAGAQSPARSDAESTRRTTLPIPRFLKPKRPGDAVHIAD
ncbi:MAG: dienelactone hydrolase family protein [Pseudomonadota bacterium]